MTTEQLYREKIKGYEAAEKQLAADERRKKAETLKQRAVAEVAAEQVAAEKAAHLAAGEAAVEALAPFEPFVEIHTGCGKVVRVDLSATETVARGTAVESVRRACFAATEHHRDRVARSRQAGAPQPAKDFVTAMVDASSGLLYGIRAGVVSITEED